METLLSPQMSCAYASLILADDGVAVTMDKLQSILKAANISVEPVWAELFANALKNCDVQNIICSIGSGAGGASSVGGGAAAPVEAAAEAADAGKPKKEAKADSESDDDMGLGLFD